MGQSVFLFCFFFLQLQGIQTACDWTQIRDKIIKRHYCHRRGGYRAAQGSIPINMH